VILEVRVGQTALADLELQLTHEHTHLFEGFLKGLIDAGFHILNDL